MDQLIVLIQNRFEHFIDLSIYQIDLFKVHSRNQKLQLWKRNQIHSDFIQIDVKSAFESHRSCQIAQHIGYNVVHLFERSLLFFIIFFVLLISVHYVYQSLIVHWKYTITIFDQFVQWQQTIVGRSNHIVIFLWKYWSRESEYFGILIS